MKIRIPTEEETAKLLGVIGRNLNIDKEGIESRVARSVSNGLDFFDQYGIHFNREPVVRYVDINYPLGDVSVRAITCCPVDFLVEQYRALAAPVSKMHYAFEYGLEVSLGGLVEDFRLAREFLNQLLLQKICCDADIILWKSIVDDPFQFDQVIIHEMWHYFEFERNLMVSSPLIIEGTATFVENIFRDAGFDGTASSLVNQLQYNETAKIVRDVVGCGNDALIRLVTPAYREEINSRFYSTLYDSLYTALFGYTHGNEYRAIEKKIICDLPIFSEFRAEPSTESLLRAYSKLGLHRFVYEVTNQDLTRLVAHAISLLNE